MDQTTRVRAVNRVIDELQARYNWNTTKKIAEFTYLQGEEDYSIENDLSITDFKDIFDIRVVDDKVVRHLKKFEDIEERNFAIWGREGQGRQGRFYTIEERSNDKILRILKFSAIGRIVVHQMDNLTANGTWASDTTGSDATTLAVDVTRKKEGASSLKFNIDVSQSVNDFAQISTTTVIPNPIDGTDVENIGHFRFWIDFQNMSAANLARITNVEFRWGNSSTVFWSDTTSTAVTGGAFIAGFNRVDFDWGDATETGTVDPAALDYFEIRVNYASTMTDTNNIRVDEIVMLAPIDMQMVYFSQFMVDASGSDVADQPHFNVSTVTTSETLMWNPAHFNLIVDMTLELLFPQKSRSSEDFARISQRVSQETQDAVNKFGNEIIRERQNLEAEGQSHGRLETRMW